MERVQVDSVPTEFLTLEEVATRFNVPQEGLLRELEEWEQEGKLDTHMINGIKLYDYCRIVTRNQTLDRIRKSTRSIS